MEHNEDLNAEAITSAADAYLKKAADNLAHAQEMTQAMWNRLNNWQPHREFQRGELTTGQAAEECHCSTYKIARACEQGRIKGAWREEREGGRHGWWHIPSESLGKILAEGYVFYADLDRAVEATKGNWIRQFTTIPT